MEEKLNAECLQVVLVVDLLEKTTHGIMKVSYEKKNMTDSKILGIATRALSGLTCVLDKYKEKIDLTALSAMDKKIRSEVCTTERDEFDRELLIELSDVIKKIAEDLKIKYGLQQKSWYI
jgi:hypothetical protein